MILVFFKYVVAGAMLGTCYVGSSANDNWDNFTF